MSCQWLGATVQEDPGVLVIVRRVAFPVGSNAPQGWLTCALEEHLLGQGVDERSATTSTGDDRRVPGRPLHERLDVLCSRPVVPGPGLVVAAQVPHESASFRARGPILAKEGQLALQKIVFMLTPDVVELDLADQVPFGMPDQTPLGVVRWRQLPFVAGEDETWRLPCSHPHLVEAVEALFKELRRLVYDDEIIAAHDAHGLRERLVEQEGAVARVQLRIRMALLHTRPLDASRSRESNEHARSPLLGPPDATVQDGRLACARSAGASDPGAMLLNDACQALVLLLVLHFPKSQGLVHPLVDVALEGGLLRGEDEVVQPLFEKVRDTPGHGDSLHTPQLS